MVRGNLHFPDREARTVITAIPTPPDLQFHLRLLRGLCLHGGLWLGLGFALDASGVLRSGVPLCPVGGVTLGRVGGLGEQFVEPGRLVVTAGLAIRLLAGSGAVLRCGLGLGGCGGVAMVCPQ